MGLSDDLGPGMLGLDTAIFIYFIEASPPFLPLIRPLFLAADAGQRELVTSAVRLLEVLLVPYQRFSFCLWGEFVSFGEVLKAA